MTGSSTQACILVDEVKWKDVMDKAKKYAQVLVGKYSGKYKSYYLDPDEIVSQFYLQLVSSGYNPALTIKGRNNRYIYVGIRNLIFNVLRFYSKKSFITLEVLRDLPKYTESIDFQERAELEDVISKLDCRALKGKGPVVVGSVSYPRNVQSVISLFLLGYETREIADIFGVARCDVGGAVKRLRGDIARKELICEAWALGLSQ